jgi:tetratricopeptide (TPR) repeat protein
MWITRFLRDSAGCVLVWLLLAGAAHAAATCEPVVGHLATVEGTVMIQRSGASDWMAGALNAVLCQGDLVRAGERSRATVTLANQSVLRIDQNTAMRLDKVVEEPEERSVLSLLKGAFQSFSRKPRGFEVNTPYLNGSIEGTEFVFRVEDDQSILTVLEGTVLASNDQGSASVSGGESVVAEQGKAPQTRVLVHPRDAVQWSLYYPPVLSAPAPAPANLEGAVQAAGRGDTSDAFAALDRVPATERNAQYHVYRASLLLSVGRVEEMRTDIDQALKQDPNAGAAYALRAVVNVVQNADAQALADARQAVDLSPESSAARIALSYAQQAEFDISAARDTMLQAVQQQPDNALAWARLSELQLMLGDREVALQSAQRAESLDPDSERAQITRGYAALAVFRNDEAQAAFERAIALDSADPLAHLGLGLARISQGDLAAGGRDIEVAVALDANDSLLRSYLGKTYFEEKRTPLDFDQFSIAKELDPLDPTPWLYSGIARQTVNQPVEAVQDLEKSIELNDNRAVYRGRLLLDEDRASRGTSLARAYNNLGFEQLGLEESTESLTIDPANASAHRFLSDTYRDVRRREISRVSELLQAQMLQDININPIQPSISETNLNIVTAGGAATPGFNEFTPLFQQNQTQFNVSGFGGNDNTYGGEGVVTGVYDSFSYSAGAFSYDSDGWRKNNDLDQRIYNLFGQWAVTPDLNIQAELRRRDSREGDLAFNFDPNDFLEHKTIKRDNNIARAGLRYSPGESSDLLVSYVHSKDDQKTHESTPDDLFFSDFNLIDNTKLHDTGSQPEAQFIYRQEKFNLVTGGAYSHVNRKLEEKLTISTFTLVDSSDKSDIKHPRGYAYSNVSLTDTVTGTAGASYDHYKESDFDENSVNPKLGVQWNVTGATTLRAAAFKVMKPALVNNRTLEPTQVAGFNQFFDDINGTKSWRYGVGVDSKLTPNVSVGSELTWRKLNEPVFTGQDAQKENRDERNHRVYVYWTPTSRVAVSGEAVYDYFEADKGLATEFDNLPEEVETVSVPLNINYFSPTGYYAGVGGTFVHQDVDRSATATQAEGNDSFFLVDLAVGYRFPKRLGVASLGVKNVLDKDFKYQDDSYREFRDVPSTGPYFPDRIVLGQITLSF